MSIIDRLKKLPVYECLAKIDKAINSKPRCLLGGPTGSGKTCGITGLMIDKWYKYSQIDKSKITNIKIPKKTLISLPTIASVRSLYEYQEKLYPEIINKDILGWAAGGEIHYNFKTTPVIIGTTQHIINRLMHLYKANDPSLYDYILMVDEAHHPSAENYVLLKFADYIIKKQQKKNNHNHLNLVISSATLNNDIINKKILKIEVGYRKYPIKIAYHNKTYLIKDKKILLNDTIEVLSKILSTRQTNGVLIFTSGENECETLKDIINKTKFIELFGSNKELNIVPYAIYGNQPYSAIEEALKDEKEKLKIVISTNIAESSITVPFVDVVIDTCIRRFIHGDERSVILIEDYVCQDNSIQRAGRAGRVRAGYVYRMIKEKDFNKLEQHDQNEFHRIIPYGQVINLLANDLPANSILDIDKEKFKMIMLKLINLGLITKKHKILPRAINAIRYPISIESATILTHLNKNDDNIVCLTLIIISMLEASRGGGFYWYPPEFRSGKKMYIHQNKFYSRFSGECDLDSMVKLFIAMNMEPKSGSKKDIIQWATKNKLNSKTMLNAKYLYSQLHSYFNVKKNYTELLEQTIGNKMIYKNKTNIIMLEQIRKLMMIGYYDCIIELKKVKSDVIYTDINKKSYILDTKRTFSKLFNKKNNDSDFPLVACGLQFTTFQTGATEENKKQNDNTKNNKNIIKITMMSMVNIVFPLKNKEIKKKKEYKIKKHSLKKSYMRTLYSKKNENLFY